MEFIIAIILVVGFVNTHNKLSEINSLLVDIYNQIDEINKV